MIDRDDALADAAKRAAFIDWLAAGGLPDLGDDLVMVGAWKHGAPCVPADLRN